MCIRDRVLERPGAVALFRVILSDDVLILVVDVYLFVVVGVLVIVRRGRIDRQPLSILPDGERLLDNYDLCRMLNISKRTLSVTAPRESCLTR